MIELQEVVKSYRTGWYRGIAPVRALDGVTLRIEPGASVALVGLNGAGKSTLLRILLGYLRPSSGEARIGGLTPREYVERTGVAYVPERVTIPSAWTVHGALRAYAMLGNLEGDAWERIDRALDRLGLQKLANRRVGSLSKGNLQRVAIAQALLADRKLMVLDEPTDGLDPVWVSELRVIVRDWLRADPERVLVLASHNLAEVARLAARAVLLHNGRVATDLPTGGDAMTLENSFLTHLRNLEEARE